MKEFVKIKTASVMGQSVCLIKSGAEVFGFISNPLNYMKNQNLFKSNDKGWLEEISDGPLGVLDSEMGLQFSDPTRNISGESFGSSIEESLEALETYEKPKPPWTQLAIDFAREFEGEAPLVTLFEMALEKAKVPRPDREAKHLCSLASHRGADFKRLGRALKATYDYAEPDATVADADHPIVDFNDGVLESLGLVYGKPSLTDLERAERMFGTAVRGLMMSKQLCFDVVKPKQLSYEEQLQNSLKAKAIEA